MTQTKAPSTEREIVIAICEAALKAFQETSE